MGPRLLLPEVLPGVLHQVRASKQLERGAREHLRPDERALVRDRGRHRDRGRPVVPGQIRDVGREVERDRRHRPRDVADVVRAAALGLDGRRPQRAHRVGQSDRRAADLLLHGASERAIRFGPSRQPDRPDVPVHRLRDGPAEVPRIGLTDDPVAHLRVGHERRALRHAQERREVLRDERLIDLADVVPDGRGRRHDVRLVPAVHDAVVRALLRTEVLAAEIPAGVHELDRVERAPSPPGRRGAVRGLARERELGGDEAGSVPLSPGDREVRPHVGEQHRVHVAEAAVADVPRLRAEQLLGDARPEHDRTR